ncbi:FAD:protein FMN transferase [Verrucomicrobium spinosum]|uniref:FAD:protein FMN transferase n=1 Tax=Verrucomicrobium spinosum TaxID=2736 RepID=UPI00017460AE|nr:FAD:protein FMN transferase [Verrucomicrobium spinosum]
MTPLYRARHEAMATEFEIIIAQDDVDAAYAGNVADAVFAEIDRLEDELSRFRPMSDIWRVNHLRKGERAPVGLAAADCLALAKAVHAETNGAFDITIGPLMKIFRNSDGTPRTPSAEEVAFAQQRVGIHVFDLDETGFVTSHVDYPLLDLGAVGKGYALDQVVTVLEDWSVQNVLLNAGDSSILAIGAPPGEQGWVVSVGGENKIPLRLTDRAVSGSGFQVKGNHIMNPRTFQPMPVRKERVWASAPTAALSDALSTAFAVMTRQETTAFCARHLEVEAIWE